MATKKVCDGCNKEIKTIVKVNIAKQDYDVCNECEKKIIDFIGTLKPKEFVGFANIWRAE